VQALLYDFIAFLLSYLYLAIPSAEKKRSLAGLRFEKCMCALFAAYFFDQAGYITLWQHTGPLTIVQFFRNCGSHPRPSCETLYHQQIHGG
jgi:hypothetical protein